MGKNNTSINIERLAVSSLTPYANNARTHSGEQVEQIARSIQEFGFTNPVLVDKEGGIIAGHGRVMAAERLGLKEVPCIRLGHLTEAQKRAYIIADNKLALNAGWDDALLAEELRAIGEMDFDLSLIGFDPKELEIMLNIEELAKDESDAEPQIDKAEELNKKWQVKTGDLWLIGDHRLLCGDSTSAADVGRLLGGEKADAIVADPPYGMRLNADFSSMVNNLKMAKDKGLKRGRKYADVIGDHQDFDAAPVLAAIGDAAEQFWFGADYYSSTLPDTQHTGAWLVWDKRLDESADKMFGSCFELCWSKRKCKRDIIRIKWAGVFGTEKEQQRGRQHPNQKPVALLAEIVGRTEGIVIDPFLGSGTTMVAGQNLGRKVYGLEISPAYCAVILQRMKDAFPSLEIKRGE